MGNPFDNRADLRKFLIFALVLVGLVRLLTLGAYAIMDKTEARYAEIAREMVATDDWVSPQLDPGVPFWGKPPLSIWLTALSLKVFGVNAFAARLPAFLLAVLTCALTFFLGRILKSHNFGLVAAVILATTGFFFVMAGSVMTDPALTFCVTLSMVSFIKALQSDTHRQKLLWGHLFFIALGLSLLAKGPVGWVLTFFPIVIWTAWHKQWKKVFTELPWLTGILLALMIAVPWHIAAEKRTPGFLEYYLIGEHWRRFAESGWAGDLYGSAHAQPRGMIWPLFIPATLPWTIVLGAIAAWLFKQGKRFKDIAGDLWLSYVFFWFMTPFVIFTAAGNILMTYLLPGLPAFAVLVGYALWTGSDIRSGQKIPWFFSNSKLVWFVFFVPIMIIIAVLTILPQVGRDNSQRGVAAILNRNDPEGKASLIYTDNMPDSADFYTQGRSIEIRDGSREKVLAYLNDNHEDFFAVKKDHLNSFPDEAKEQTREVGRTGDYIIFQEIGEQHNAAGLKY